MRWRTPTIFILRPSAAGSDLTRVKYYANMFGLGELAGYNIPGEQLGVYPSHVLPESQGGVGRMCSFGESVSVTPLQLGALISAIANGGTLYYLQHPETPAEVANFHPRVKRELNIGPLLPAMSVGMTDVVKFGTGRPCSPTSKSFQCWERPARALTMEPVLAGSVPTPIRPMDAW